MSQARKSRMGCSRVNESNKRPSDIEPTGELQWLDPEVYQRLRQLARLVLRNKMRHQTMNTTAVVHEAYLKLYRKTPRQWQDKAHFFRTMAQVMQQIVIDYARHKNALMRGGAHGTVGLDQAPEQDLAAATSVLPSAGFARALEQLARLDATMRDVFVLRYVAGFTLHEIADFLDTTVHQVDKASRMACTVVGLELSPP